MVEARSLWVFKEDVEIFLKNHAIGDQGQISHDHVEWQGWSTPAPVLLC